MIKLKKEMIFDKIRGCIFGGAAGDALGYPVEFMKDREIFEKYGERGIASYELAPDGKALISDDTQMSLFTATGVLVWDTLRSRWGETDSPSRVILHAYGDWLATQDESFEAVQKKKRGYPGGITSWLADVKELYSRRAPGATCLNALRLTQKTERSGRFIDEPVNGSKGCGGIMRIAPFSCFYDASDILRSDTEAAQIAAVTHGHSLGYMPTAVLSHILSRLISGEGEPDLRDTVIEARDAVSEIFRGDPHLGELRDVIDLAVGLSENGERDLDNVRRIGEGWVAEETLGIAIYCSLRHRDDFSAGVIAAVNHSGDSDSTGAVTGNILGAIHGFAGIGDKWKKELELADLILEVADDVAIGRKINEFGSAEDERWICKYVYMCRPK